MGNSNNGTEVGTLRTVNLMNSNTNGSYALNGKIMLCTVVILFFTVFLILGFHTYARWFFHSRRRRRSRLLLTSAADGDPAGLDAATLKSLPTFTFAAKHQPNISDCAVCLSDFEIGESGRVLPGCGHCFHTECIDMWFGSHSSCPLCRAPVRVGREPVKKVPEPAGNSSAELVGIIVEVPQSMEERYIRTMAAATAAETGSGSPGCNRAKSPDNRVLSMKRIWSI